MNNLCKCKEAFQVAQGVFIKYAKETDDELKQGTFKNSKLLLTILSELSTKWKTVYKPCNCFLGEKLRRINEFIEKYNNDFKTTVKDYSATAANNLAYQMIMNVSDVFVEVVSNGYKRYER